MHRWDGSNIVSESVGNTNYTYYRGVNIIAQSDGSTTGYYHYNGHGDTTRITSASGEVLAIYDYDAFGNETGTSGNIYNPFRYCGEYSDEETGLIYLRARYYAPSAGRFITEDPAKDGLNWYSYCAGNPVNFVDPWGMEKTSDWRKTYKEHKKQMVEYYMRENGDTSSPFIVTETENSYTVYAYVSISGYAANDIVPGTENADGTGGITYRQAAIDGITETWSGEFEGKNVEFYIVDLGDGEKHNAKVNQKRVKIYVDKPTKDEQTSVVRNTDIVSIRTGDIRPISGDSDILDLQMFKEVAGHEFGHAMGLGDVYMDKKLLDDYEEIKSIMNYPYGLGGAQPVDYDMLFNYNGTGTIGSKTLLPYSREKVSKYSKKKKK